MRRNLLLLAPLAVLLLLGPAGAQASVICTPGADARTDVDRSLRALKGPVVVGVARDITPPLTPDQGAPSGGGPFSLFEITVTRTLRGSSPRRVRVRSGGQCFPVSLTEGQRVALVLGRPREGDPTLASSVPFPVALLERALAGRPDPRGKGAPAIVGLTTSTGASELVTLDARGGRLRHVELSDTSVSELTVCPGARRVVLTGFRGIQVRALPSLRRVPTRFGLSARDTPAGTVCRNRAATDLLTVSSGIGDDGNRLLRLHPGRRPAQVGERRLPLLEVGPSGAVAQYRIEQGRDALSTLALDGRRRELAQVPTGATIRLSPNGQRLAASSADGLRVISLEDGSVRRLPLAFQESLVWLGSSRLAFSSPQGLGAIDVRTGALRRLRTIPNSQPGPGVGHAVAPDGFGLLRIDGRTGATRALPVLRRPLDLVQAIR